MNGTWTINKIEVGVLRQNINKFEIKNYKIYYTDPMTATVIKAFDGTNTRVTNNRTDNGIYVEYTYPNNQIHENSVLAAITFTYFTIHDTTDTEIARFTIDINGNTYNTLDQ